MWYTVYVGVFSIEPHDGLACRMIGLRGVAATCVGVLSCLLGRVLGNFPSWA